MMPVAPVLKDNRDAEFRLQRFAERAPDNIGRAAGCGARHELDEFSVRIAARPSGFGRKEYGSPRHQSKSITDDGAAARAVVLRLVHGFTSPL